MKRENLDSKNNVCVHTHTHRLGDGGWQLF